MSEAGGRMRIGVAARCWRLWPLALLIAALAAAACGGNPNEDVDADEFFRPSSAAFPATERAGDDAQAAPADSDDGEQAGADDGQTAPDDDAPPADDGPADTGDEIDLADDVVRRYLNASYGYSLELVCGSFCDATSNAIDRVGFLSDDRTALIRVEVLAVDPAAPPGFDELHAIWLSRNVDNASYEELSREETVLPSDGVSPALLFEWTIDRRATGGFLERYRSLITVVGPIAYFLNAGGIDENFASHEPSLDRAIETFLARREPANLPGTFSRWGFALPYDPSGFSGELGNRTQVPSFDSGVFVQQADSGEIRILLIWDSISQALFDPDTALDDALAPPGGVGVDEEQRGDATVDGQAARFVVASTADPAGNTTRVAVYAWYCGDSGRSFVLQSFDSEDPVAAAGETLDGFRCDTQ